jgi:intergrase/recombinase
LLREYSGISIDRRTLTKYVKRRDLLLPKYVRKIAWRLMIKAMPREVARFIQSRFGELRVSEARYEDLLGEADQYYPGYLKLLLHLEKGRPLNQ